MIETEAADFIYDAFLNVMMMKDHQLVEITEPADE